MTGPNRIFQQDAIVRSRIGDRKSGFRVRTSRSEKRILCNNESANTLDNNSENPSTTSRWSLSREAFERLLEWLDDGALSHGEAYLRMRKRLVSFFDRKGFANSDDLADETLNRVARRLEEEGSIETEAPAKYCYIVARFVFHESLRSAERREVSLDEVPAARRELEYKKASEEDFIDREERLACLDHCVGTLDDRQRDLIFGYYFGQKRIKIENRRRLAKEAGISLNALSIRAFRIREKLEACLAKCLETHERN